MGLLRLTWLHNGIVVINVDIDMMVSDEMINGNEFFSLYFRPLVWGFRNYL